MCSDNSKLEHQSLKPGSREVCKEKGPPREKKEIERKPSTDFEILLMTDG